VPRIQRLKLFKRPCFQKAFADVHNFRLAPPSAEEAAWLVLLGPFNVLTTGYGSRAC
jgi:hypothetical protein